jgi:hypothetical protein
VKGTISTWLGVIIGVAGAIFILIAIVVIFVLIRRRSHLDSYSIESDAAIPQPTAGTEFSEISAHQDFMHTWEAPDADEAVEDSPTNDFATPTPNE